MKSHDPIVFFLCDLLFLLKLRKHHAHVQIFPFLHSFQIFNLIISVLKLSVKVILEQLAIMVILRILLPKRAFFNYKLMKDFFLLLDIFIDLSNILHSELDLVLQTEVHSLWFIGPIWYLIFSYFSHPILNSHLQVLVTIFFNLIWIMLVLSFYLMSVLYSDKSMNLILVTIQILMHWYMVMTVGIIDFLFELSYSVSFFRRIFVFFLNDLKLHRSWLEFKLLLLGLRFCFQWGPITSLLRRLAYTVLSHLIVIEVHILHLSERHIFHIAFNVI